MSNNNIKNYDFLPGLLGSFAEPAVENPTVAIMEAAFRHHGLHYRYINCEVGPENLEAAVNGAKAMGWRGFNCSIPNKIKVIRDLDELGESAKIIGAVNTVVIGKDGKTRGENTGKRSRSSRR
jgi:shikimate 5-dehydrogenase